MNKNTLSLRNFEMDYLDDILKDFDISVEDLITDSIPIRTHYSLRSKGVELLESCQGDISEPTLRWSVLKIGEEYWKVEFKYYSFSGYEWEDSVAYRVTPKEKLIVVWEAE